MGTLTAVLSLVLLPAAGSARQAPGEQFREAHVCARCHVVSVVEWGMSAHRKAGANCTACHGTSRGHVVDERNNIKPERIPHGEAIATLCAGCHASGCPKTNSKTSCETCHHVHALVDPRKPPATQDERLDELTEREERAARLKAQGELLLQQGNSLAAREAYRAALSLIPNDPAAKARLRLCERRLHPSLPGFEPVGGDLERDTGLPREVCVNGAGIVMVLVPGGEADIGSERLADARPVHTVRIEPFYLGKFEITQAEWVALMGDNPSAHQQSGRLPVELVSWEDAQAFLANLNERVPGGGFRLPTEAEWEFAARAGVPPSGAELARVAWFEAPDSDFAPKVAGSGQPNKLGLFDMQGNVWEWCSSLAAPYPYNAWDGRESLTAAGLRVLRGGGYADQADLLDPALRHGERPNRRLRWNGLRIARSAPAP